MIRLYIYLLIINLVNAHYPLPYLNESYGLCVECLTNCHDNYKGRDIIDCTTNEILFDDVKYHEIHPTNYRNVERFSNYNKYSVLDNRFIISTNNILDAKTRTIKMSNLDKLPVAEYYDVHYKNSGELIEEWYFDYYKNRYTFYREEHRKNASISTPENVSSAKIIIGTEKIHTLPILFGDMYIFLVKEYTNRQNSYRSIYYIFDNNMNIINRSNMRLKYIRNNNLIFFDNTLKQYHIYNEQDNIFEKLNGTVDKYTYNGKIYNHIDNDIYIFSEIKALKSGEQKIKEKYDIILEEYLLVKSEEQKIKEKYDIILEEYLLVKSEEQKIKEKN